ncbi:MAG: phage tail protein [Peptostreptococcaceae bacterium]|nr:phage tail protein [Peptostreptococcaceae bacterium]
MTPILYDKTGNVKLGELTNCIECLVEEERNGLFEVSLIYPTNDTLFNSLEEENIIVCNANDTLLNQKFRIYMTRKLMSNKIEVFARHISFDLAYDYINNIDIKNQSCEYALNTIFRNSQFSTHYKGHSDIINAQDYKISKVNCIEAIGGTSGSILDTFGTGAEILRDNTNIHVLNKRGYDNGVSIEYAKNLTGFELEEDYSELITRIIPFATYSDSETSEEVLVEANAVDSDSISDYSHPYISYMDFSDKFGDEEIPTTEKLTRLAKKYFKDNECDKPKQNFKIEFVPLSKCVGYEGIQDNISLCDTVTIKDTRYNIDTKAKVIKTVFNVLKNRYESMELGEPRTTLGDIIGSNGNEGAEQGPPGPQGPPGQDGSIGDFPNTLPKTPVLSSKVYGFANIELSWTYENKVYYNYEVYGSKTKDFTPNTFDLIHAGQTSSYLFQAKPNETWYFRVCAVNTHGERTPFSSQVTVNTVKIDDLSNYVSDMAIGDALIDTLNLGRGWYGELKGNYIDAKQLSVTDGNGKRTLDIDSFGNVRLDVTEMCVNSESVATNNSVIENIENVSNELNAKINQDVQDVSNIIVNMNDYFKNAFKDEIIDDTEKENIRIQISQLEKEKADIIAQIDVLKSLQELQGTTELTKLISSNTDYINKHTELINAFNLLLENNNDNNISENMQIHFVKCGTTGDCIVITYKDKVVLIDGNESSQANTNIAYMQSIGIKKIDYVIATHHHSDHTGGTPSILRAFDTAGCIAYQRTIDFSKLPEKEIGWGTKECHDKFIEVCNEKGIKLVTPSEGQRITLDTNTYLEILNTNYNNYSDYNGISFAVLVVHKSKKYFLSGDINAGAQANILSKVSAVDVYKANHHDYDLVANFDFYNKLNFKQGIVTRSESMEARAFSGYCQINNIPYYSQRDNGHIILTSTGNNYTLSCNIPHLHKNKWWDRNNTGNWYWFKDDGSLAKSESLFINGKTYHFNSTGLCTNP